MTHSSRPDTGLPPAVVGWIVNHATKNYWRVARWYELDDLIQDGLVKAYECRARYGEDVDPPHFMALVKTSFYNHIGELLRTSRPEDEATVHIGDFSGELSEGEWLERRGASEEPGQELAALVAKMPRPLRRAVELYLRSPEALRSGRVYLDGDEDTEEASALRRLAGWPRRFDFETELRAYLWEALNLGEAAV